MDIAYEKSVGTASCDLFDALSHAACGTVGERKAEHLPVRNSETVMGMSNASGQDVRFATSRPGKQESCAALTLDDTLLEFVGHSMT